MNIEGLSVKQLYDNHQGKVSDKWLLYLEEYDRLFLPYRENAVNFLEIGVQNGGSLEIWAKYFGTGKNIVGCDVNATCAGLKYDDPRIQVVVGDINSDVTEKAIKSFADAYDIVIDDGSHRSGDIVRSFCRYFRLLKHGGLYVVEDLSCSYWQKYEGGLYDPYSSISFFKRIVDCVNHEHWGIEKTRAELIHGFGERYGVAACDELLGTVHSVEFLNSLCIVRKRDGAMNNLRDRVVVGQAAMVSPEVAALSGLSMSENQCDNPYSSISGNIEERYVEVSGELAEVKEQLQQYRARVVGLEKTVDDQCGTISSLYHKTETGEKQLATALDELSEKQLVLQGMIDSLSWQFTKPARKLLKSIRKRTKKVRKYVFRKEDTAGNEGSNPLKHEQDYGKWVELYGQLTSRDRDNIAGRIALFPRKPLISVLMPVYNTPEDYLEEAIRSVINQLYPNWELCIADDHSDDERQRQIIRKYAERDGRIRYLFRQENGHISVASNSTLEMATGDYVVLLDHDDVLSVDALYRVAKEIVEHPDVCIIYSDEDKLDISGSRCDPYYKPRFNYNLLLSQNYLAHLIGYRTSELRAVGGFREGYEGSQDYDLCLRVVERVSHRHIRHIPRVLYHWRIHKNSMANPGNAKPYAHQAAQRAINEHLERMHIRGEVLDAPEALGMNRVRYALPERRPSVDIIILTRDKAALLKRCIDSIVQKTMYSDYRIVVIDNGSEEMETHELFAVLRESPLIKIIRVDEPFNFSRLNNYAVERSTAEYVCLMNNDIKVISRDWLDEMLGHGIQEGVGAVGARLWYPDDRLQHGGVVLGIGGVAGHAFKNASKGSSFCFSRSCLQQEYSAVTGACLLVKRDHYIAIGGLDENNLAIAFNDVDFCLRLRARGLRNVWTPYAEMYHHESASRGYEDTPDKQARFQAEINYMKNKWCEELENDFSYNPNLSFEREDFALAWPPRTSV